MAPVRRTLASCVVALVVLLAGLPVATTGWLVALVCAGVLVGATALRAAAHGVTSFGPADLVTLTRATLACGVAGLAAGATGAATGQLVVLAALALLLDLVDGQVARRTGTASGLGAWMDGEADAFLVLVLSLHVARSEGAWVAALGLVRYAYALALLVLPWMRRRLPPRYWRKVVAAYVGVTLAAASSGRLPAAVTTATLLLAAGLLAESFGRDVVWCWRGRHGVRADVDPAALPVSRRQA